MIIHTVRAGESIYDVAAEYGVSPLKLAAVNGIAGDELIEGEELLVLIPTRTANARRGERLAEVAARFGVCEEAIAAMNPEIHRGSVYQGQPITVRAEPPLYGLGIGNGYFYRGARREQLMRALPYLSYVTVCSAVARRGGVSSLFDAGDAVSVCKEAGKLALMRLRAEEGSVPSEDSLRAAVMMAHSLGAHGLTLSGVCATSPLLGAARAMLSELGMKLVLEIDAQLPLPERTDADFTVLIYDKLHLRPIPPADEGEGAVMREYAERTDASRAFIDLSPFALFAGKYITKREAREAVRRGGGKFEAVTPGTLMAHIGKKDRARELVTESLTGVRGRLELVSECGFYGITFDIARVPTAELMMFSTMFSRGIKMR